MKYRLYEYPLYGLVTLILMIMAIPLVLMMLFIYLVRSTGAPMKSLKYLFGFIIVLLIVAATFITYQLYKTYDIGPEIRSITIVEHDSFSSVTDKLQQNEILHGRYLFKYAAIVTGVDKSLATGRYDFKGKISQMDILYKLKRHEIATLMVTIPEGLTVYKTAGLLANALQIDSAAFVNRAFDTTFTKSHYDLEGLEGYLFPETYRLWYGIKIDEIIKIMVNEFTKETADILAPLKEGTGSRKAIVILASIIEAEAYITDEKALISSVYHNRLRKKMLLQADPTVIYALGGLDRPLTKRDLDFDSPYNTYRYKGLTPGPINSPGLDAIRAAVFPEQSDYFYFVAEGGGRHVFSRTLAEHNRAIRKIKRDKNR